MLKCLNFNHFLSISVRQSPYALEKERECFAHRLTEGSVCYLVFIKAMSPGRSVRNG